MRKPDWNTALAEAVERHRALPFAWGESDCGLFVADCILAVTGEDPAAAFRGRYDSERSAARRLFEHGYASVDDVLAAHCSQEIHPAFAGIGDAVAFAADGDVAAGICLGPHCVGKGRAGLTVVPLARATRAFRVG